MAQGTPSNCDAVAELIPGYALEALIQADQALVEGHVAGCPGCRAMLAEHRTVAEGLVYTPPLVAAPPHLEADLRRRLEQARAEAVTRTPFPLQAWLSRL
ncbi:MAG: anti-sigma factor family protein, partial [Candidatus Methylomirabilia bacterium]